MADRNLYKNKKQTTITTPMLSSEHKAENFSASEGEIVETSSEQTIVAYDEHLFERARTQWQFGDWQSLAELDSENLQDHPDRAKLALYAAVGLLQLGRSAKARQLIRRAQSWGLSKNLICKVLAAGIHNSLGRASLLIGHQTRALQHFESSISVADPKSDIRLLTQARISQQCSNLGFAAQQLDTLSSSSSLSLTCYPTQCGMRVVPLAEHALGEAWAGNTINTVIFRHHGIVTRKDKQFTAFYVDGHTMRLVQRDLKTDSIQIYDISGDYNLYDAHNSISLGIDRADHLHICYDHHVTKLRYRRSIRPNDITAWTDELSMTGKAENKVTYPSFILPHDDFPLTLLYRDGFHDRGNACLKTYDEEQQCWHDHPQLILSGSDLKPWTSNAYWNHPVIGGDGSLHLSFVWRTYKQENEDRINNINIGYACSPDNGISWLTSKGRSYRLPITPVNAETIHPVSLGSNLINQCSMALDSQNRPHIVFYADDSDGVPQYQHLRYDGKQWHHQIISQRKKPFVLQGGGTLQIPISRPEIVIDRQDNAFIITRGDHSENRMIATMLAAPDYLWFSENTQYLCDGNLGFAEPIIDRERWTRDNVLTLLLQHNEQPNHDKNHRSVQHPINLVDVQFKFLL